MIISRRDVPVWILCNRDPEFRDIFEDAFQRSYGNYDEEQRSHIRQEILNGTLSQIDMGYCFRGYFLLMEKVDQLDREKPYDNGLSLKDVNKVYMYEKDKNGMILEFMSVLEDTEQIVGFARIEEDQLVGYADLKK